MARQVALLIATMLLVQTQTHDDAKKTAVAQMRRIVNAIKVSPEEKTVSDWVTYYSGPPANVEWDVTESKSVRAPFLGLVTFNVPQHSVESEKAKHSKKLPEIYIRGETYFAAHPKDGYFRYELDLGNGQPELVKMLFVDSKTKEETPITNRETCWAKAAAGTSQDK